jgi:thiol-disulfide isomerase/thioredoxin
MKFINISFFTVTIILTITSCHRHTVATASTTPATANAEYTDARGNLNLLGKSTRQRLQQAPFDTWFNKNFTEYNIDSNTANRLKPLVKNKQFVIFMATWCGDSRREVPRIYKLLDYCGVKPAQVQLINLNNHDTAYKQSPTHEEKGLYIHRVPTLLVYADKKEKGRVVETPVTSLEKDLLAIIQGSYEPQYRGTAYLVSLFRSSSLQVIEKNLTREAEQLKPLVKHWGELCAFGRVLLIGGEVDRALIAFQLSALLYPKEVGPLNYLADGWIKKGNIAAAKACCQNVLQLQPGNQQATAMLAQLSKQ